jgi:predicted nucleotidyltransferase
MEPSVVAVYGFGSRARGEAAPTADVDIGVLLGRRPPLREELLLRAAVVRELGRDDVDLVVLDGAPPLLRYEVVATGSRLFARDEVAADAFEAAAYREYFDTAHLRAVQRSLLREATR